MQTEPLAQLVPPDLLERRVLQARLVRQDRQVQLVRPEQLVQQDRRALPQQWLARRVQLALQDQQDQQDLRPEVCRRAAERIRFSMKTGKLLRPTTRLPLTQTP